nr:MBL fold metallo-hydrolase [uncultured Porphyromonas sp.]
MTLSVLGSSSAGNAYILRSSSGEKLLIECGVDDTRLLEALDYDLQHLSGCLLSHEHGDHSREARWVTSRRIPLYCSAGTAEALQMEEDPMVRVFQSKKQTQVGSFTVLPFDVKHDASEPLGFLIEHEEMGRLLFVTDSYLLRYRFRGVTHWLIECNYNTNILQERLASGAVHPSQYKRTLLSHMSYEACLKTLLASDLTSTRHIVLIHLSDGNSDAERCRLGIAGATGKDVRVATRGMTQEINRTPF